MRALIDSISDAGVRTPRSHPANRGANAVHPALRAEPEHAYMFAPYGRDMSSHRSSDEDADRRPPRSRTDEPARPAERERGSRARSLKPLRIVSRPPFLAT